MVSFSYQKLEKETAEYEQQAQQFFRRNSTHIPQ